VRLWQYLGHVEPLSVTAPPAIPKWDPVAPALPPARSAGLPIVVLTAAAVLVCPVPAPAPATSLGWSVPLSEPQPPKRIPTVYTGAERPLTVLASPASRLDWYVPLSEPTRRIRPTEGLSVKPVVTLASPGARLDWYQPISVPPSRARQPVEFRTGADLPTTVPVVAVPPTAAWAQPLSEPPLRARRVVEPLTGAERPSAVLSGPAVRLDWYQPLPVPTAARRAATFETGADHPPAIVTAPGARLGWYQPLPVPRAARPLPVSVETGAERPSATIPVFTVSIGWYQLRAEPPAGGSPPVTYDTGAEAPPATIAAPGANLDWYQPLALPPLRAVVAENFGVSILTYPVVSAVVPSFAWYVELATPLPPPHLLSMDWTAAPDASIPTIFATPTVVVEVQIPAPTAHGRGKRSQTGTVRTSGRGPQSRTTRRPRVIL